MTLHQSTPYSCVLILWETRNGLSTFSPEANQHPEFKTFFVTRSNCNENKDSVFSENHDFDSKIKASFDTIYNNLTYP